jgi:hypothetical protein
MVKDELDVLDGPKLPEEIFEVSFSGVQTHTKHSQTTIGGRILLNDI